MPIKGTDLLVEAFLRFPDEANVELLIAGRIGGDWGEQLVSKAAASPLAQKIKFVGFESNSEAFLSNLDVFVLPSRSEGMSNSLLEAMASGLPCIATDVGSNSSLLRGRQTAGLICQPSDADLYRCMVQLYQDEALRENLGYAARQTVETEYSMPRMVNGYRQLYRELLDPLTSPTLSPSI
jgi:glycosyltransferase involved in cell wall biosynthesis